MCDNFGRKNASCGIDDVRIMGVECSQKFTPKEANPNFMLENGLGIFKGGSLAEILTGKKMDLPPDESNLGKVMTGFGGKLPPGYVEETTTMMYTTDDYDYDYDKENKRREFRRRAAAKAKMLRAKRARARARARKARAKRLRS